MEGVESIHPDRLVCQQPGPLERRCWQNFVRRRFGGRNFVFLTLVLSLGGSWAHGQSRSRKPDYVPGELIVAFKEGFVPSFQKTPQGVLATGHADLDKVNAHFKAYEVRPMSGGAYVLKLPKDTDILQAVEAYSSLVDIVRYAEPNYIMRIQPIGPGPKAGAKGEDLKGPKLKRSGSEGFEKLRSEFGRLREKAEAGKLF